MLLNVAHPICQPSGDTAGTKACVSYTITLVDITHAFFPCSCIHQSCAISDGIWEQLFRAKRNFALTICTFLFRACIRPYLRCCSHKLANMLLLIAGSQSELTAHLSWLLRLGAIRAEVSFVSSQDATRCGVPQPPFLDGTPAGPKAYCGKRGGSNFSSARDTK